MKLASALIAVALLASPSIAGETEPGEVKPAAAAVPAADAKRAPAADAPRIDVVFCIDRSGSMDDVIETAKRKVWSIVNEVARAKPSPELRIGLIGYGSGTELLHTLDLTNDLDEVYKHLTAYRTGASGAEFVGHAIHEATGRMKWAEGKQVLKIIYVVGNETARQGPSELDYAKTAPAAIAKGIMVNAIYCGTYDKSTAPTTWREFAKLADGQYMEIAGDGGAVVIATPFDAELADLNTKLNGTYVGFGGRASEGAANQVAQDKAAAALAPATLADRVVSKSARQYSNRSWDLVDASKEADFDLAKVKDEELPDEMRKLDAKGRKAYVEQKSKERDDLQKSIKDIAAKRDVYVKEEIRKTATAAKPADSFDAAVRSTLRTQAESKGFAFEE
jgi:Mg-chelatase subunit ChlD